MRQVIFKSGDKVFDIRNGWGVVRDITDANVYNVVVDFLMATEYYTYDGRCGQFDSVPLLRDHEYKLISSTTGKIILDEIAESAVKMFDLDSRSRDMVKKDQCRYFFRWWKENKNNFKVYNSLTSIARLCNRGHATVIHSLESKDTNHYEENVHEIKLYLSTSVQYNLESSE
jgi:hypothetical protein